MADGTGRLRSGGSPETRIGVDEPAGGEGGARMITCGRVRLFHGSSRQKSISCTVWRPTRARGFDARVLSVITDVCPKEQIPRDC